jgi:DnaJ-class molecular chaperone
MSQKTVFVFIAALLTSFALASGAMAAESRPFTQPAHKSLPCATCHGTATPSRPAPASACMKCHGSYDAIAKRTAKITPNPHDAHVGQLRCTLCHKAHQPSVLYCDQCHDFKLKTP